MHKAKQMLKKIKGYFPTEVPRKGMSDFNKFADDIIETYGLPNYASYRQAIATEIMHLPQLCTHKPKRFFAKSIYRAQANQIAYEAIQLAKEAQKNERETVEGAPA